MNLKCKVNEKEYNLAQGIPFSDEYNETLDSCSVIIPHCYGKINMYPYDDFYVYDKSDKSGKIYKHYLIHQFNEENINLVDKIYTYKIELFSETKGLETVQLPNISVTQAVYVDKKKSVYKYICDFVDLYNPKLKFVENSEEKTWVYKGKYKIADTTCNPKNPLLENDLEGIFGNVFAPEFTLNNPNLRDLLAKLFLVKDMIPVVEDNVIYAMDITKRRGEFNAKDVNYIAGSRSSENHCDNLRRTYYDALSQDFSARRVEMLGFRNSNTPLLTISNMRLETNFPIYKINKVYMCYYKKIFVRNNKINTFNKNEHYDIGDCVQKKFESKEYYKCLVSGVYDDESLLENSTFWKKIMKERAFLCKQDITKLVQLNSRRELLSQDWDDFENNNPESVDDLAQYKLCTVGYDIGSKYITGWGNMYTYPKGFWDIKKTYIQNIAKIMDDIYPYGIYNYDFISKELYDDESISTSHDFFESIISPIFNFKIIDNDDDLNTILFGPALKQISKKDINDSIKMKSLFFEIDYNAFISGTVVHSKDLGRDNITNNDNSSSSLTMVGPDGLYQKEKINRFGNKGYVFTARHASIDDLQPLGSVYSNDDIDDVVIYHREYSICDNVVIATYYGMHDYVLKNYFTSVYAKHRPYSLMSYGESIRRSENNKTILMLSKDKVFYEESTIEKYLEKVFSFSKESLEDEKTGKFIASDKINYAYIIHDDNYYTTDINSFVSGNSLCFNMSMYDNASMGVYIKNAVPDFDVLEGSIFDLEDTTKDITGSVQDWYMSVDDKDTGYVEEMGFYVCHLDKEDVFSDGIVNSEKFSLKFKDSYNITNQENIVDEKKLLAKLKEYRIEKYVEKTFNFSRIKNDNDEWYGSGFIEGENSTLLGTTKDLLDNFGIKVEFSIDEPSVFKIVMTPLDIEETVEEITTKINNLPKIESTKIDNATNKIGDTFIINKDNKEIIDMTYQYEPITTDKNISFSSLLMNLSDLIVSTNKKSRDILKEEKKMNGDNIFFYTATRYNGNPPSTPGNLNPIFILEIPKNVFENIENYNMQLIGDVLGKENKELSNKSYEDGTLFELKLSFQNIEKINEDEIILTYRQKIVLTKGYTTPWQDSDSKKLEITNENMKIKLKNIKNQQGSIKCDISYPNNENYYFTNNDFSTMNYFSECDISYINFDHETLYIGKLEPYKNKIDFGEYPIYFDTVNQKLSFDISKMRKNNILLSSGTVEIKNVDEKNMYVVLSETPLNKTVVYDEFKADEEIVDIYGFKKKVYSSKHLNIVEKPVPMFFRYERDENKTPYIRVELYENGVGKETKSVQYWFRDDESGSFKFVFGVNLTDEDYDRGYVKIYISAVKSRDERVFNENYEVIGNVVNFADDNNEKIYGENQYYCDIIE